ncbi:MFS transporter [Agromyces protaetiae]|uniref:MFS transporter n=1 Tax=Agromyces protaetiae TaxID=2509455 RepID=A0A4P6F8E3_9MICO|nr:MFS transporter [Agromyces protaetiae]QAY72370.1 MFS transporter [Agromyces protaetiae]
MSGVGGAAITSRPRRGLSLAVLVGNQLLAGVGVASGIAVAALLAEDLTGTALLAGLSQTSSVLGAGIVAIPLARLAVARGRHVALALGYGLACLGAVAVIVAAATAIVPLVFVGLAAFGAGSAAGLQARFAATEVARPGFEARAMSLVLWATTIGSVAGPNLSEAGAAFGRWAGLPPLAGPFVFSGLAFAISTLAVGALLRLPKPGVLEADAAADADAAGGADAPADAAPDPVSDPVSDQSARPVGTWAALTTAARNPTSLLALLAIVCSHTAMVAVMVMTPVHLHDHGGTLGLIGLVISIHILGMYGASPIMGWLVDRFGPIPVIGLGAVLLAGATMLGVFAPSDRIELVPLALGLLGLGWSAGLIGGSALLTVSVEPPLRVPLQGGSDAAMNFAAALASASSGAVLAAGGFAAVNVVGALAIVPLVVVGAGVVARTRRDRLRVG